ncbi:thiol reductant ABC exporter subunit CydD [Lacticaseibacillus paracasei]|uniref:Cytochrome bd biosynthesis ABC-type transporter, ATPase and permease component n=1 Tax=Lacticaseibacillus paracasei (strain ATCC 334 / BCRC 17002 / CCUG 31169 / CIP 107868 / KCTC 3260 / NRRL B-441) TaxID=321967 RepID=Q036C2_LACP3|nr:thiol reductant ABC exporter subunit CydD [Lacticaseibacillus paracasei]ABJ70950.1 Cytochrome bd biosynthesis ABC-type transporter, ATPase and permease component [Lacticaseibacillus paracasei ATCC 334]KRK17850.1 cytochrome bd biosynthesis ABC-type transporter, ATPase and permease component [Lacticaseibacillus casei DSM 20011 = JCM 1134 = ATCC 393]OSY79724.1 thiol reductant ABC exporter subunit CydD [Lacticaseibacillus paracasei]
MIDKTLMRLSGMKRIMTMLAGFALVQAFVILLQGKFLAEGIVHSWNRQSLAGLWLPLGLFATAFVIRQLIVWVRNRIGARFAMTSSAWLQAQLLKHLYALGPAAVAKEGTGNLVTMALDGIPEAENYIELILNKILNMSIIPWVLVAYIWYENWLTGFTLLIMFPIIILFMVILGLAAQDKSESQYAGFQKMSNHFIDSLRGLKTLQLMGISRQYANNVYDVSEDYRKQTMGVLRIAMLSTFALDFFTTLSIAVVAVFLGIKLMDGAIPLYPAMVALILAPEYFMPIRDFGTDYHATLNGKNAMKAIWQVIDQPLPTDTNVLPAFSRWQAQDTVTINHLDFTYPNERAGIQDANLQFTGTEKVAIIGASGSGKSTLLNLIGGFLQPQKAAMTVRGTKVPHMTQAAWQDHLSYIPQDPYLFADTIAANIRFYRPDASDEDVKQAAEAAGLSHWIETLADGYATRIGEGGRGISGGQAQRIALARTLIDTNRSIWLFDEPTAHLDIETEAELKETLVPLFKNRLVIFATHRLHWLNQMDRVIVVDGAKIIAEGTPSELAAPSKPYQALVHEMRGEFNVLVEK